MCFHQAGESVGALDISTELNMLPAFAVAHRAVGDSLEEVRAFLHRAEERVGLHDPRLFRPHVRARVHDLEIETIELLPHFGAALFAYVAEIFARGSDAGYDR